MGGIMVRLFSSRAGAGCGGSYRPLGHLIDPGSLTALVLQVLRNAADPLTARAVVTEARRRGRACTINTVSSRLRHLVRYGLAIVERRDGRQRYWAG
jgi:hypothetical protein